MRKSGIGQFILYVPSLEYLESKIFPTFKKKHNTIGASISENPLILELTSTINPFSQSNNKEKLWMLLALIGGLSSAGIFAWDVKLKRREVQNKVSFLNQLVHEVKTPITGIKLNSELLMKYGHDQEIIGALLSSSKKAP